DGPIHYGSVLDPFTFPVEALAGRGSIAGTDVRCESPEWAVRWRTGYAPRPNDLHDVPLLCGRFGIPLPAGFCAGHAGASCATPRRACNPRIDIRGLRR